MSAAEASRLVYQERSAGSRACRRGDVANRARQCWSRRVELARPTTDFAETGRSSRRDRASAGRRSRALGGVEVVVLLREVGGEVRGNLRAKTGFDVGSVAREFDGGGHAAASGFTLEGTIDDVAAASPGRLPGG